MQFNARESGSKVIKCHSVQKDIRNESNSSGLGIVHSRVHHCE